jgi:cytidylate kinase
LPRTRQLTIALAGAPGSGKSTIARLLAARLDGAVVSFGDYVRHLATSARENNERSTLQRIGQDLVRNDPEGFVRAFLDWASPHPNRVLIIDGVRHAIIDDILRSTAARRDSDYLLLLLQAPIAIRAIRRCAGNESDLRQLEDHPVEREAATRLPSIADLVVDSSGEPSQIIALIARSAPPEIACMLN